MSRGLKYGIIFAIIVAIVAVIVYFTTGQTDPPTSDPSTTDPTTTDPTTTDEPDVPPDTTPVSNPVGQVKTVDDSQKIESQPWRDKNPGVVIKKLDGCGEAKTYDGNIDYEGPSRDNYANYCYNFIKSVECADKTCSVPQVFGACRDECTGRMNGGERMNKIGPGAGRITYAEYKAWRDKTAYPGSGAMTWNDHCAWKESASLFDNMHKC